MTKKIVTAICKKPKQYSSYMYEGGLDECGRGSLALRCYAGFVILPKQFNDNIYLQIKDSKKLSIKKREMLSDYIKKNAVAWGIGYTSVEEIDTFNILNASVLSMHRAVDNARKLFPCIIPEFLVIDGIHWKPYYITKDGVNVEIPFKTIPKGDDSFMNIAAASIIAKVAHDHHVIETLAEHPYLEKYNWKTNMCYGTQQHIDAIKKYGVTEYHRKTFGVCKSNVCLL